MLILLIVTACSLIWSSVVDFKKTIAGIKKGLLMFLNLIPILITVLILVSIFLSSAPKEIIIKLLGKNSGLVGILIAAVIGSISLIPAFISYPLAAILLKNGVSYSVTAVFITTLLMVGVLTLPLEAKYFGWRVSILRNIASFLGAIVIGLLVGLLI